MSDIIKEIKSEEYQKKLLQAWIASRIAYNDELVSEGQLPEIKDYEENYSKFDHGIEKIIASKDYTKKSEFRNLKTKLLSKHVICECVNNRLIIALTIIKPENKEKENNFVADFFGSIEDSSFSTNFEYNELDSINKCIRYHGSLIPIDHLIDKLIEGYELVFTGYSFGAALAALLAIRVLLTERNCVDIHDLNRVSFIGFGCPLFVNETFQKFIENKQHKDKFYFYRHENDFNVNFFDLNTAILKRLEISSESENMNFMKAKFNELILSVSYPFELSEETRELFLNYLESDESLKFSDSDFKQQPFVRFGHNLTISSTGNKVKLNEVENYCNYYNIEILKSIIKSIKSYNLNDYFNYEYFNDYFDVSVEQNNKSISYLEEFKIGRTFEYLFYPDYSRRYKNSHEITDRIINENTDQNEHFTMNIIQSSYSDVFLGIYNSKKKYLKTVIGIFMYMSNDVGLICSDYKEFYITIWYTFKPMKKLTGEMKFILYTLYEEIPIKPPANITEIELIKSGNFEDKKKICTYEMTLDLLYIHAFFFIYIVKKSKKEIAGKISDNCFKIMQNYDNLDQELKIQSDGTSLKSFEDEKKKEYIKKFYEQFKTVSHMKAKLFEYLPNFFNLKLALVSLIKNPKLLWTCLTNVSNKYNELEIFESFRKAMWYFKIDQEADLNYIYAVKELEKELEKKIPIDTNQLKQFSFEEIIRDNKETLENQDMEEMFLNKSKFLNSVVSNFNIREALEDSCLIGIEGYKKAGKSTFVDFFLKDRRHLGSASIETKEMSAYRFSEDIDMLLVDYPHYNSTDEFHALQFECSKYILDFAFMVCDAMIIGDTMTVDLVNILGALNSLGVNRYCVIMNKFDQMMGEDGFQEEYFLASEIDKYLRKKKNSIISQLEEFDKSKHFQTNREELKNNLLIIPTTLNEPSDPEIQYKYQRAGIFFGEDLKKKLLETIHDNIKNKDVKPKLKGYYAKEKLAKKCRFITKLNNETIYKDIDINKGDEYSRIIERIKESFEGIGDLSCIKPELSDPNSDPITSIDGFFNNKGFVFIVENNNEKECAFIKYPELELLMKLEVTKNEGITFEELQSELRLFLRQKFKLKNVETFWIKPQLSLPDSSESITSIDGLFNSKGCNFIVEIYKKCFFEMKQHPQFNRLEVTINEKISFNELQRRIKEHFGLDSLETFWIKPQLSLPDSSESITSINGFFNSKGCNFIVEIYKECFFEMKQHPELKPLKVIINKDIPFDELQRRIKKHFGLDSLEKFWIKPQLSEPYLSGSSITSIDGFFKSKWFTFIVEIYKECFFEMKQHPELKRLEVTINEKISFNELQRRIKKHFGLDSLETFWIKPQLSLADSSESITSIDGLFNSKGFTFIVEKNIYL